MGDNSKIYHFRKDLEETINKAPLPIEVKRMVVNDFVLQLNQLSAEQIQKELSEESEEKSDGIH